MFQQTLAEFEEGTLRAALAVAVAVGVRRKLVKTNLHHRAWVIGISSDAVTAVQRGKQHKAE
jgi:hypothetical protein